MSWLYSAALVEAYLAANSSGGEQSVQSRLSRSVVSGLLNDKTKAFYRPFPSGAETSLFSTVSHGEELLTWFRVDSLVRTSAQPILTRSELPVRVQVSGKKCSESFAKLDRPTSLWRMSHRSGVAVSEECSAIFPPWGMMRNGECWELMTSGRSISESVCSSWPTVQSHDQHPPVAPRLKQDHDRDPNQPGNYRADLKDLVPALWPTVTSSSGGPNTNSKSVKEEGHGNNLVGAVKKWPTVTAQDSHGHAQTRENPAPGDKSGTTLTGAITKWPTAQSHDAKGGSLKRTKRASAAGGCKNLMDDVTLWPTMTKSMQTGADMVQAQSVSHDRGSYQAAEIAFGEMWNSSTAKMEKSGQLSPEFVEFLQGFPIGWTASEPLGIHKFRSWLPQSGISSQIYDAANP